MFETLGNLSSHSVSSTAHISNRYGGHRDFLMQVLDHATSPVIIFPRADSLFRNRGHTPQASQT